MKIAHRPRLLQVAARARELGLDHSGRYAAVLDAATVPVRARPSP